MNAALREFAKAMDEYIRPETFPVAVKMLKKGEAPPVRAKRPKSDLGIQAATCQAIAFARRHGWVMALGDEDISCPLTAVVFGFRRPSEFYIQGGACEGFYTKTRDAGLSSEAMVEKFDFGSYEYLLAAPIHRADFDPDVIVIYGNSAQVMRLLNANLWKEGGRMASSFGGRIDCAEEIIAPMHSGKCEIILPCYGDRIFAQTQDHEMAFSIPVGKMDDIVEGLKGTHNAGVRYPVPSFLRYTGSFPEQYEKAVEE